MPGCSRWPSLLVDFLHPDMHSHEVAELVNWHCYSSDDLGYFLGYLERCIENACHFAFCLPAYCILHFFPGCRFILALHELFSDADSYYQVTGF